MVLVEKAEEQVEEVLCARGRDEEGGSLRLRLFATSLNKVDLETASLNKVDLEAASLCIKRSHASPTSFIRQGLHASCHSWYLNSTSLPPAQRSHSLHQQSLEELATAEWPSDDGSKDNENWSVYSVVDQWPAQYERCSKSIIGPRGLAF